MTAHTVRIKTEKIGVRSSMENEALTDLKLFQD